MSLTFQHLFAIANSPSRLPFYVITPIKPSLKKPNFSPPILSRHLSNSLHLQNFPYKPQVIFSFSAKSYSFPLKAYQSDDTVSAQVSDGFNLDAFLSIAEFLCIVSSAIITISYAVNSTVLSSKKTVLGVIGSNKAFAWGLVVMVSGMVIGAWIRRRQWLRFCRVTVREGRESVNLVERIEKLEEDLRSSATIIRVLSRQLEKLGIRFRVTRKALKEPVAETAALAKKNSEATRALAVQEDILEKELGEIQKVLLAMQQQKQLELILAIGKSGKLWESKQEPCQEQAKVETSDFTKKAKQLETQETRASGASKGTNNDKP
ncbi:uncharacterized protein LOC110633530 isoform X2 [Hevea brasiliensis]|uniref:uncharacterized protein LOC110633530 isoform X2 n=1 Tax=Hevea brasiliensis TaxID=3981 RepID=UPI0025CD986E|nr:uncharacterized protein LOC110633530 isoform X2 [Hevea brasiliensis]